jgi:hypothetical protein
MRAATYKMPEADFERLMDIIKTDETQYVAIQAHGAFSLGPI